MQPERAREIIAAQERMEEGRGLFCFSFLLYGLLQKEEGGALTSVIVLQMLVALI
jgi:hypothetical protein